MKDMNSVLKDVQNPLNDMEHVDTDLRSVLGESELNWERECCS